jgi:hypothetical protein
MEKQTRPDRSQLAAASIAVNLIFHGRSYGQGFQA